MPDTALIEVSKLIEQVIKDNVSDNVWQWLNEKTAELQTETNTTHFNTVFALVPRKTGRHIISTSAAIAQQFSDQLRGFSIHNWTIDRLCRLYVLQQLPSTPKPIYCVKIQTLFTVAEMNELAALYSALPLLNYPEHWTAQCAEGIRSNIGTVLEAIMYHNPYPSKYLDEKAWNQLVLKAFFTEKDINRIVGVEERNNKDLADTLLQYANERSSAGRSVNPQLWLFVAPFLNDTSLPYIQKLFTSSDPAEINAAALVCDTTPYQPAKDLLQEHPAAAQKLATGTLNWKNIHAN